MESKEVNRTRGIGSDFEIDRSSFVLELKPFLFHVHSCIKYNKLVLSGFKDTWEVQRITEKIIFYFIAENISH